MCKDIKFLVMDVDGTLTDGYIYIGDQGEVFKKFNVKDGCGIKDIIPEYGIIPIIITARNSEIMKIRCYELGINELYQGIKNKRDCLNKIITSWSDKDNVAYSFQNVAYIGDDILDLQCMIPIKEAGGLVGCPSDAVKKVLAIADFISVKEGGCGAVRDFIEWIIDEKCSLV